LISRITENKNNKEKERKHWIPNQVGDDIGVVFGDDSYYGSLIRSRMTVGVLSRMTNPQCCS